MNDLLSVENVTAGYYEDILVLKSINVKCEKDRVTCIVGSNGAGKSTLLKTIFGFLTPFSGRVMLDGRNVTGWKPHEAKKSGMGYLTQEISVFPFMTVEENLRMGWWTKRNDTELMRERIEFVMGMFPNLVRKRKTRAAFLSGGEMRMLDVAKAMLVEPKILLVDEPSAGLSPKLTSEVYDALAKVKESTTILLVDQNVRKALEISDYAYLLETGEIRLEAPADKFREQLTKILGITLMGEFSKLQ